MKPQTLEALVWVLIYGGLLIFVAGLAIQRDQAGLGQVMMAVGALIAGLGFAGIYLRSRMHGDTNKKSQE